MNLNRFALLCLCIVGATTTYAARTENPAPLPNCGSGPECAQWKGAVAALNDLGGQMGGGDIKPKPKNKQPAINACVLYQQRIKKLSRADAQNYCAEHAVGSP